MKLLVVGASGLVGSHVYEEAKLRGHEVVGTYRNYPVEGLVRLDLGDDASTRELMQKFRPDWVVHAAGWTWVDGCEQDPERAFRENCDQPAFLAKLCHEFGSRFAYFSTTYVFDGTKNGPYTEEDVPNPINVYAKSKWAAEQKIQEILSGQALIPRVIWVWGKEAQQKNFVYQVIRALREGRVMKLPSDQIGNPSWAGDIAWWLMELMHTGDKGVWNLAGSGENTSRIDWFTKICQGTQLNGYVEAGAKGNYEAVATVELNQQARRPLHAGASTNKIQGRFPRQTRAEQLLEGVLEK